MKTKYYITNDVAVDRRFERKLADSAGEGEGLFMATNGDPVLGKYTIQSLPCCSCGQPAYFSVGWLVPTRKDAHAETADTRPCCSVACAGKVVTP